MLGNQNKQMSTAEGNNQYFLNNPLRTLIEFTSISHIDCGIRVQDLLKFWKETAHRDMGIAAGTELKDPSSFGTGEETEED